MNLDDIEVGESYEIPGRLKDHHFPGYGSGVFSPAWYFYTGPNGPWTVVEKGIPYGKRVAKIGVRIQFTVIRRRPCEACGNGWVADEDGNPIMEEDGVYEGIVPATMIEGRWDQREIRRDLGWSGTSGAVSGTGRAPTPTASSRPRTSSTHHAASRTTRAERAIRGRPERSLVARGRPYKDSSRKSSGSL